MMKAMGGGKRGPLAGLASMMGMGGGMPSPEEMAKLAEKMPGGVPRNAAGDAGLPAACRDCRRLARPRQISRASAAARRAKLPDARRLAADFGKKK